MNVPGQMKSEHVDVTRIVFVNGARFEQLMEHDGQLPSAKEQRKRDENIEKLAHETPNEQTARLCKEQGNRSFLREVLDAFDFRLIGEEIIDGSPAYVLQATPHSGYHPRGKYGKILSKVEGKLWVDKQDFGWSKVEGHVTQSFSMGLFVARVERGARILVEQICIGDAVWMPKRIAVRASARILFIKSLAIERILTYSDYRPMVDSLYSIRR